MVVHMLIVTKFHYLPESVAVILCGKIPLNLNYFAYHLKAEFYILHLVPMWSHVVCKLRKFAH